GKNTGFPSEFRQMDYLRCEQTFNCDVPDSLRLINQRELFHIGKPLYLDTPYALVSRVHPVSAGSIDIYMNGDFVATRWIPELPGYWLEFATVLPFPGNLQSDIQIEVIPHMQQGYYAPAAHWLVAVKPAAVTDR